MLPEAVERLEGAATELASLRAEVVGIDQSLCHASTGFGVRRLLLERETAMRGYADKHVELVGVPPTDVAAIPEIEGDAGEILKVYAGELARLKRAQQRSDALAANDARHRLDLLDARLDVLLKGAAE